MTYAKRAGRAVRVGQANSRAPAGCSLRRLHRHANSRKLHHPSARGAGDGGGKRGAHVRVPRPLSSGGDSLPLGSDGTQGGHGSFYGEWDH